MIALVTGGAASGKSAYAEQMACSLSPVRTYLATMSAEGAEAKARIAKHRAQRAEGRFATIEVQGSLAIEAPSPEAAAGVLLLDDVGNLASCALFGEGGIQANPDAVLAQLTVEFEQLAARYAHVVVVGNLVGGDGGQYDDGTLAWIRLVGALCCAIAARSDQLVEVVAGCPLRIKG